MSFKSIDEIRRANKKIGHHWFDEDDLAFFQTELEPTVMHDDEGSTYFITSEKPPTKSERLFSIRVADPYGAVITLGTLMDYSTADEAWEAVEEHIEHVNAYSKCKACW